MPETTDAGLRLAIYARVSTEEQREGQTIDSQVSELERFARDKAWLISGTYKDEGWSGASLTVCATMRRRASSRLSLLMMWTGWRATWRIWESSSGISNARESRSSSANCPLTPAQLTTSWSTFSGVSRSSNAR